MTRLTLSIITALTALLTASTASAAAVTVLWVQPPRMGPDGSPIPIITDAPQTTESGYSVDHAGTVIASAVGSAESGLTKYEVKNIDSRLVFYSPDRTDTVVSEPVTLIFNIEQGSGNILREKIDASISTMPGGGTSEVLGLDVECIMEDDKKKGVCKGNQMIAHLTEIPAAATGTAKVLSTSTETLGTTFTGQAIPVATITTSGAEKFKVQMPFMSSFFAVAASVMFGAYVTL